MMAITLGCIGDDYTGSSDLANALTRSGLRTIQTIGVPSDDIDLGAVDAVVIALKSRSVPADEAVAMTLPAHAWLTAHGARHILFKICSTFDSTDRGNIGPVMDALRTAAGAPFVLVNPAFPEMRRTIYLGNLFVGGVPLNESPLRHHPLNPMLDSNLVRVLERQASTPVGLIELSVVEAGTEAIRARVRELKEAGLGAAIVDCVSDRQLAAIGHAALDAPLSIGASGLGIGLAGALLQRGDARGGRSMDGMAPIGGPIAMLSGSCSAATLEQVEHARQWAQVYRLDARKLIDDPGEIGRAIAWSLAHVSQAPVLIASSGTPDEVKAIQARYGAEASSQAVEGALASIAAALSAAGVRRLIVAGGETSGAVVNHLGYKAFAIGEEIAPGVPILRTLASEGPAMSLALKSGNFGTSTFFADAVRMLA
jgi:uncharacterized protein YgbK (DUF1537 family)